MLNTTKIDSEQQAVCGQAHAVFNILNRTGSLPTGLSLSIEEILERAWEIAYNRSHSHQTGNVVHLFAAHRTAHDPAQY